MKDLFVESTQSGKALHHQLFQDANVRLTQVTVAEGLELADYRSDFRGQLYVLMGKVKILLGTQELEKEELKMVDIPPKTSVTLHAQQNSLCLIIEFFKG